MLKFTILFYFILLFGCLSNNRKYQYHKRSYCLSDTLVIKQFVNFLNDAVPEYQSHWNEKIFFDTKNCFLSRAHIHDLSDSKPEMVMKDFTFKYGHVYHFYILVDNLSFSHIAYVNQKGQVIFFKSINCKNSGYSLSNVLDFLNKELSNMPEKESVLNKVRNYRSYMVLGKIDDIKIKLSCDCEPCN